MTAPALLYPADVRGLSEALAALGDTEHQVAAALAAHGCLGRPGDACRCPIARYLELAMPCGYPADDCGPAVEVEEGQVRVRVQDVGWISVPAPPPVGRFVNQFDWGAHGELVRA